MKFLLFILFISFNSFGQKLATENAPRMLKPFAHFIKSKGLYSEQLDLSFKSFNLSLNQAYASSTANQVALLNELMTSEMTKWILIKGKQIKKDSLLEIPEMKKNPYKSDSLRSFLFEAIKNDLEQIEVSYPNKKFIYSSLSKVDQKKVALLAPWNQLISQEKEFDQFITANIHLLFEKLAWRLKIYAMLTPKLKKELSISYLSFEKKSTPSKMDNKKTNSEIPTPVQEWQDLNIYRGRKSDNTDSRGLPTPVDDWILEL